MTETNRLNKCVFLDRDGVINEERGDYTYRVEDFRLLPGVPEALRALKSAGYLLIVVTNQSGISKGLYTRKQMQACHDILQKAAGNIIDHIYYCPYHPSVTSSLCRKPGTLMIERALARYHINPGRSWMVGDADRDIACGLNAGLKTIRICEDPGKRGSARFTAQSLEDAVTKIILPKNIFNVSK